VADVVRIVFNHRRAFACPALAPTALLLLLVFTAGCQAESSSQASQTVQIDARRFVLEIADTPGARERGLSGRTEIPADGGMLFVFPDAAVRSFWMRGCLVDIDIIYLDAGGRIVAMHAMKKEPPETPESALVRYSSDWPAQYAIELRGGTLAQLNLRNGQKIDLPLDALKARAR